MSTLAEFYDVSAATVQDLERRGAPVQDPAAMADFVMDEREIKGGYERAQAVADRLPKNGKKRLLLTSSEALIFGFISFCKPLVYRAFRVVRGAGFEPTTPTVSV